MYRNNDTMAEQSKFVRFFSLFFTDNPQDETINVHGVGVRHCDLKELRKYSDRMAKNTARGENHEYWDKLHDQVLKDRSHKQ